MATIQPPSFLSSLLQGSFFSFDGSEGGDETTNATTEEQQQQPSSNTFSPRSWKGIIADLQELQGPHQSHPTVPYGGSDALLKTRKRNAMALALTSYFDNEFSSNVTTATNADLAQWLRLMLGFDLSHKILFVNTPNDALLTSIRIALARKYPTHAQEGFRTLFTRPPVIYISAALDSFTTYIVTQLGFPRTSIVTVPNKAGENYMDVNHLRGLIERDTQDIRVPLAVIAANGFGGQVDDIAAIAELTSLSNIWLHTIGDSVVFNVGNKEHKPAIAFGDSTSFTPGRWLAVSNAPTALVLSNSDGKDASVISTFSAFSCFEALPLWITLRSLGMEAAISRVQLSVSMLEQAISGLTSLPGIRLVNKSIGPLCDGHFVYAGLTGDSEDAIREINDLIWPNLATTYPEAPIRVTVTPSGTTSLLLSPIGCIDTPSDAMNVEPLIAFVTATLRGVNAAKTLKTSIAAALSRFSGLSLEQCDHPNSVAVRYSPHYTADISVETAQSELARINHELVTRIHDDANAPTARLHLKVKEWVTSAVQLSVEADTQELSDDDISEVLLSIQTHGHSLEDQSMHLTKMSKTLQQGILEAQEAIRREQEARLYEEGLLRQVPLFGSVLNWISPQSKATARSGRAFDLSKGKIMETFAENSDAVQGAPATPTAALAAAATATTTTETTAPETTTTTETTEAAHE